MTEPQRREVFTKVLQTVDKKFMGPDADTTRLRAGARTGDRSAATVVTPSSRR